MCLTTRETYLVSNPMKLWPKQALP